MCYVFCDIASFTTTSKQPFEAQRNACYSSARYKYMPYSVLRIRRGRQRHLALWGHSVWERNLFICPVTCHLHHIVVDSHFLCSAFVQGKQLNLSLSRPGSGLMLLTGSPLRSERRTYRRTHAWFRRAGREHMYVCMFLCSVELQGVQLESNNAARWAVTATASPRKRRRRGAAIALNESINIAKSSSNKRIFMRRRPV